MTDVAPLLPDTLEPGASGQEQDPGQHSAPTVHGTSRVLHLRIDAIELVAWTVALIGCYATLAVLIGSHIQ